MSRGPGRIERAIRALFDAHPDLAFVKPTSSPSTAIQSVNSIELQASDSRCSERRESVIVAAIPETGEAWRIEKARARLGVSQPRHNVQSYCTPHG